MSIMLCLLIHRALNGRQSPTYVAELLQPETEVSTRHASLWSANKNDQLVPQTALKFDERAFSVATTVAWNSLPTEIHSIGSTTTFNNKLKGVLVYYILQYFWTADL